MSDVNELHEKGLIILNAIRQGEFPFTIEAGLWEEIAKWQKSVTAMYSAEVENVRLEYEQKLAVGLPEDDPVVSDLKERLVLADKELRAAATLFYQTYLHAQVSELMTQVDRSNEVELKVEPLRAGAKMPEYKTDGSAGLDLCYCPDSEPGAPITIPDLGAVLVPTGLRMEIPKGYVGKLYIRSGLAKNKDLTLANSVGVIDSDYRGEVMVMLRNESMNHVLIQPGERIGQLIVEQIPRVSVKVTSQLSTTERGEGGFGSTGEQ